jgi:hypothetical protein
MSVFSNPFIVTFFVIATKKVTKEKSRQTRSLRAFCQSRPTLRQQSRNSSGRTPRQFYKFWDLIFDS